MHQVDKHSEMLYEIDTKNDHYEQNHTTHNVEPWYDAIWNKPVTLLPE